MYGAMGGAELLKIPLYPIEKDGNAVPFMLIGNHLKDVGRFHPGHTPSVLFSE